MEFTVNRSEFRTALATASSILFRRDTSVLGHVLLVPRDGYFLLTGTNQGMVIQAAAKARCRFGPNALLPWRVRRVLSALETKDVSLRLLENAVQISGGRASFTLRTPDPQLYPEPPQISLDETHVEVSARQFRRAVRSTAFATSRLHAIGSALRFVGIAASGSKITFTATDGTRIACYSAAVIRDASDGKFRPVLISPDFLVWLSHLTRDSNVRICFKDDNVAVFVLGDSVFCYSTAGLGFVPEDGRRLRHVHSRNGSLRNSQTDDRRSCCPAHADFRHVHQRSPSRSTVHQPAPNLVGNAHSRGWRIEMPSRCRILGESKARDIGCATAQRRHRRASAE
jgi:DNA polymerase III sliding clamp (beta) subunit (PCNA family)